MKKNIQTIVHVSELDLNDSAITISFSTENFAKVPSFVNMIEDRPTVNSTQG